MIDKTKIEKLVLEYISGKEIFLVKTKVTTANKITVLINKKSGIIIDECVQLSRHIEASLDREVEDFELQVSSPGLGEPFVVPQQFEMNLGNRVEVLDNESRKTIGILKEYKGDSFVIETSRKSKGKKKELSEQEFTIEETRSVKVKISFK